MKIQFWHYNEESHFQKNYPENGRQIKVYQISSISEGNNRLNYRACQSSVCYRTTQGGQRTWNFWIPGIVREFCGTCKMSGKSQGIS